MLPNLHIKSTTFLLFIIALVVLAVAHNLAVAFFLYWQYLWFDIPMHILGGLVVALGYLTVTRVHAKWAVFKGLSATIGVVLIIGILWELFELSTGVLATEPMLLQDTIVDFAMNITGGIVGFLLAYALRSLDA